MKADLIESVLLLPGYSISLTQPLLAAVQGLQQFIPGQALQFSHSQTGSMCCGTARIASRQRSS